MVVGQFLAGLLVGLPVAFVFRRLYPPRIDVGRLVYAAPYAALYFAAFSWEIVRANVDVAARVLLPGTTIEPEVILIPLRVETDLAVTTIANSITVTPGTVTLDHDEEANALFVHAIDGRDPEAIVAPIRTWERNALRIFDERRSPDSPPPEIVVSGGDRQRRWERLRDTESASESDDDEGERTGEVEIEGGDGGRD